MTLENKRHADVIPVNKIGSLIDEYIDGLISCNTSGGNVIRCRALLNDFYNTKIKNYEGDNA